MKFLLLLSALCLPSMAEDDYNEMLWASRMDMKSQTFCVEINHRHQESEKQCFLLDGGETIWVTKPHGKGKANPLTTRWVKVSTIETEPLEDCGPDPIPKIKCWGTGKIIELGLRSDGVVVWR